MSPRFATENERGDRYYEWPATRELFWSVTTILGAGVPKYLVPWASKLVAELAYADVEQRGKRALRFWARQGKLLVAEQRAAGAKLDKISEEPRDLALRYLKGEPDRVRDAAGKRGSDVHAAAEDLVLEHSREAARLVLEGKPLPEWPERIAPWMQNGFVAWLRAYRPRILATEATVYSRRHQYAGTGDLFAEVWEDGRWVARCIDYKSGNRLYPEVAMQCAAYARGDFIGGADGITEHPVPEVEGTAVLHLTAKGYSFRSLRYDDQVFRAFQYAREMYRWTVEDSKTAIGDPIAPDLEDVLEASIAAATAGAAA